MSDGTDTVGILIGFGSRRSISSAEELDVLMDDATSYANDEDLAVAMSIFYPDNENDRSASVLHIGVGRDYSMLEYGDGKRHYYVPGERPQRFDWVDESSDVRKAMFRARSTAFNRPFP